MILYFSGTGNSRYVARMIGQITGDQVFSMKGFIKNDHRGMIASDKPFVFVAPIYAWRIPRIVEDYIRSTDFAGSKEAYFVVTCGDSAGNAKRYAKKLCKEKGLDFYGFEEIIMPENYIAMFPVPDKAQADALINQATFHIKRIAEIIKKRQAFPEKKSKMTGKVLSKIANPLFYNFQVSAKGFRTTNKCTGCRKCIALCPLNNVSMEGERPRWGKECTHCMACICGCPEEAIEYKNKTENRNRYYNRR